MSVDSSRNQLKRRSSAAACSVSAAVMRPPKRSASLRWICSNSRWRRSSEARRAWVSFIAQLYRGPRRDGCRPRCRPRACPSTNCATRSMTDVHMCSWTSLAIRRLVVHQVREPVAAARPRFDPEPQLAVLVVGVPLDLARPRGGPRASRSGRRWASRRRRAPARPTAPACAPPIRRRRRSARPARLLDELREPAGRDAVGVGPELRDERLGVEPGAEDAGAIVAVQERAGAVLGGLDAGGRHAGRQRMAGRPPPRCPAARDGAAA